MYKGQYYNHQVAKAIPVSVQVFSESLLLDYTREGMPPQKLQWLFSEISIQVSDRNFIRINYTGEQAGTLEVNDPVFVKAFLKNYKHTRGAGLQELALRGGYRVGVIALLILIGILLSVHFFILPWVADKVVDQLPRSFDKEIGIAARNSMQEKIDTAGSALLTKFAAQMKWDTPDSLVFTVVPSGIENAYALPGGYVMVYTGLLKKLHTKEELAALLSHEVAHVTRRHSVRKLCRDMSTSLLVSVLISDVGGIAGALYSNASAVYSLTYSRKYEEQADITGLETMRRNQIDQQGMVKLMQELKKLDHLMKVPEFISTHPLTDNRIRYVQQDIKAHPASARNNEKMEELFRQLHQRYHE
ncbi:M48 family metallopeptidase [Chitinophaga filiformis]|uniref:Peptidase family M48 n=1 Tax=Chitinophaga filiformis TaxID=104663 RepID=A0A1G7P228_CHIFI|nr:M48 family metallopeptidase [Chitinophaga filiformis]SDF80284.1 Peptidase family M48 [Chitinophaga filiformis]